MGAEKVREDRYRRMLDRRGYRLMKARTRDPNALTFGGYQIVNLDTGSVDAGRGNAKRGYALDLDGVQAWLEENGGRWSVTRS